MIIGGILVPYRKPAAGVGHDRKSVSDCDQADFGF